MNIITLCEALFNLGREVKIFYQWPCCLQKSLHTIIIQKPDKVHLKKHDNFTHGFLPYALVNVTSTRVPLERQRQMHNAF